jgi:hypothetical protein
MCSGHSRVGLVSAWCGSPASSGLPLLEYAPSMAQLFDAPRSPSTPLNDASAVNEGPGPPVGAGANDASFGGTTWEGSTVMRPKARLRLTSIWKSRSRVIA